MLTANHGDNSSPKNSNEYRLHAFFQQILGGEKEGQSEERETTLGPNHNSPQNDVEEEEKREMSKGEDGHYFTVRKDVFTAIEQLRNEGVNLSDEEDQNLLPPSSCDDQDLSRDSSSSFKKEVLE